MGLHDLAANQQQAPAMPEGVELPLSDKPIHVSGAALPTLGQPRDRGDRCVVGHEVEQAQDPSGARPLAIRSERFEVLGRRDVSPVDIEQGGQAGAVVVAACERGKVDVVGRGFVALVKAQEVGRHGGRLSEREDGEANRLKARRGDLGGARWPVRQSGTQSGHPAS